MQGCKMKIRIIKGPNGDPASEKVTEVEWPDPLDLPENPGALTRTATRLLAAIVSKVDTPAPEGMRLIRRYLKEAHERCGYKAEFLSTVKELGPKYIRKRIKPEAAFEGELRSILCEIADSLADE
jgi:hypothetical protein